MKHFKNRSYTDDTYLIERRGEFDEALDITLKEYCGRWNAADFIKDGLVNGLDLMPEVPFVVAIEVDLDREQVFLHFVSPDDFMNKEPEANTQLFEFRVRRTMSAPPYTIKETDYQIPARDIFEAHVKLGQVYHPNELYDLEIVSWKKVK